MRNAVLIFSLFLSFPLAAETSVYLLTAAEWAGPRSGERIVQMDGIHAAMQALLESPQQGLLLRYPGGDEGRLWVEELRSWLWSLGLEPERIEVRPGSPAPDVIELEVLSGSSP